VTGARNYAAPSTQPPLEPALVDAEDAARLLSIGRTHFLDLVAEERLPRPVELGRRRLWSVVRLRRWAEDEAESADRLRRRARRGTA
jgi:predicted DNA-binding transcriptional regulator AlpA